MQSTNRASVPVSIKDVSKSFGSQTVFKNISLEIKAGEVFVIMGPSGSGKSVLLRTVMGLMHADQGDVLIAGDNAYDPETHKKHITSIVFQAGALFNSLSVFDNLALYPREHRLFSKKILDDKVKHVLGLLNLEHAANKMPSELSGGMKKRVAIGRALMMEPQLILFDEPTSELDPVTAASIAEIIGTLKQAFDVTCIVVSHDRELALNIADRIAMIKDGIIHKIGTPSAFSDTEDPQITSFLNPTIDIKSPRFVRI